MKHPLDPRLLEGLWVVLGTALLMVVWHGGLRATRAEYHRLVQRRAQLEARLSGVDALVKEAGSASDWLATQRQGLDAMRARVPMQAYLPQLLNAVASLAQASDVKVVNLAQGNLEPVLQDDQPVQLNGRPCARLPVTMTAEGGYHAVRAMLEQLTDEAFPGVVSVQQLELARPVAGGVRLAATLRLMLYVTMAPVGS